MVETSYGRLQGTGDRDTIVFRGIPFARPPTGALRFAAPEPPANWQGIRDATAFGPVAMQAGNALTGAQRAIGEMDEDCLTLNVWTPALDAGKRPVLVWLHGGAFLAGAGSLPRFYGDRLAARGDVVVVTINYRLGMFGFLRGIDRCGDALPSTGNEGLQDQLAALRWVKHEIAAFGGNPENVTVAGQSAGAVSISAMLAMPDARGLFHKAVLQSGAANLVQQPAAANKVMALMLADRGLAPSEAGQLRDLPAAEILDMQTRLTPRSRSAVYRPVADGVNIPADPFAAIASGSAAKIPLLVGTNLEEERFFLPLNPDLEQLTDDGLLARLSNPHLAAQVMYDGRFDAAEAVSVYRAARAERGESISAPDIWFAVMSDLRFRVPLMRQAELQAAAGGKSYAYLFTWRSPAHAGRLGAGHTGELPFVFGTFDAPEIREQVPAGTEVGSLPEQVQDAWIAFARTGSPCTPRLPDWEPYTASRRSTMLLGLSSHAVDAPYEPERRFWETRATTGAATPVHAP